MSAETPLESLYRQAFVDWLACAYRGRDEPTARRVAAAGSDSAARLVWLGTSGHVLDFDDTYLPGLAHLSAPVAPAALSVGAEVDADFTGVIAAHAAGFEAMGAVARASHPALYERGWHPTSVCGTIGSAVAASRLLDLDETRTEIAISLALLRSGGVRAAFGSDGKSVQVGLAAAAGVEAARLARAGVRVPRGLRMEAAAAYGMTMADPSASHGPAVRENWIKAYPCCLQTHSAIEAADRARLTGVGETKFSVTVHPVSRQAAPYDDVSDALQAKFSIPYLAAYSLLHGPPMLGDFAEVDESARNLAGGAEVITDPQLLESEARLATPDGDEWRVEAARGSPLRPMSSEEVAAKVRALAGDRFGQLEGTTAARGLLAELEG